jgi:endoglucanase
MSARRGSAPTLVAATAALVIAALALAGQALAADTADAAYVRVDQVGYVASAHKRAFLLAGGSAAGAGFSVRDASGATVYSAPVGPRTGSWSTRFPNVYRLDFDRVATPGTYTIAVAGAAHATSPRFRIDAPAALFAPMLADARFFFAAQRDGRDVVSSVMSRRPAHLNDARASVYAPPSYNADGVLTADLTKVGGPVAADGGWFDAGDYVKFVETHSYALDLLLVGLRDHPLQMGGGSAAASDFTGEARFGMRWLSQMWDDSSRTLYYQVGIGDGDGCDAICADHDVWRLPQADDSYPGGAAYRYIRHRPVLRAAHGGARVSPNLAGRLAAAFALCFEVYRGSEPGFANQCLRSAEHVFDLADTSPAGELLSVSPHDFYPEESWQDDLELGAVELAHALAGDGAPRNLPHSDPRFYLTRAAHWAKAWIASDFDAADTLNLYDVSALAHYELYKAIGAAGHSAGLDISQGDLLADLRRQLEHAVAVAGPDPFQSGFAWNQYDVTSHLFGLVTTASMYDELARSSRYAAFEGRQLGAALGANAWGTSFVVGAGSTFPHCMQHQVANLSGSLDGSAPIVRGAAVNGPNDVSQFDDDATSTPDGARACPADGADTFGPFTGSGGARYLDNVGAWMSVEPAIDFTAGVPLALARVIAGDH